MTNILQALEEEMEQNDEFDNMVKDPKLIEQTRRMFKFLMDRTHDQEISFNDDQHLQENPEDSQFEEEGSNLLKWRKPQLRLVTLLENSFKIIKKHCDHRFVPHRFLNDVLHGFLFLLSESIQTSVMEDVGQQDFQSIARRLEKCLAYDEAFHLNGTRCRAKSKVHMRKGIN